MKHGTHTHPWYAALLLGLTVALLAVGAALAAGNIDPTDRWAWGTNVGWINFNQTNGGVTVYDDHLEGYAWGENVGWIRLGTCTTGANGCTHANTSKTNYGVNRIGNQLSGYAWGANVGWINFAPTNGGVTVDPGTGWFDGYAWGENIGWIHFRGGSVPTAYGVRLANVLPPTPVPTLSEWGMLILAGLVAGYGAWALRRRKLAA